MISYLERIINMMYSNWTRVQGLYTIIIQEYCGLLASLNHKICPNSQLPSIYNMNLSLCGSTNSLARNRIWRFTSELQKIKSLNGKRQETGSYSDHLVERDVKRVSKCMWNIFWFPMLLWFWGWHTYLMIEAVLKSNVSNIDFIFIT